MRTLIIASNDWWLVEQNLYQMVATVVLEKGSQQGFMSLTRVMVISRKAFSDFRASYMSTLARFEFVNH